MNTTLRLQWAHFSNQWDTVSQMILAHTAPAPACPAPASPALPLPAGPAAALGPVAKAAPAVAKAKAKAGGAPSGDWITVPLPFGASIEFSESKQKMNGHCGLHEQVTLTGRTKCKIDRTFIKGPRGQGRPLGLICAWLLEAYESPAVGPRAIDTKDKHESRKRHVRSFIYYPTRVAARKYLWDLATTTPPIKRLFELEADYVTVGPLPEPHEMP